MQLTVVEACLLLQLVHSFQALELAEYMWSSIVADADHQKKSEWKQLHTV